MLGTCVHTHASHKHTLKLTFGSHIECVCVSVCYCFCVDSSDLCKGHAGEGKLGHGKVNGEIPEAKLREFLKFEKKGTGGRGGLPQGEGGAVGKGVAERVARAGFVERGESSRNDKGEVQAGAAEERVEAAEHRGIGDVAVSRRMAKRAEAWERLEDRERRGR